MNKIKKLIESANLNVKKELTFNIVVNAGLLGGAIFLYIISKNLLYLWPCILLIIIFNIGVLYRYTLIKNKNEEKEFKDIKSFINFLYLNINNGQTVESSFNSLKSVSSLKSVEYINEFLSKIKHKNDLVAYLEFSQKYKSINLASLLTSLYRYSEDKTKENLNFINETIFEIIDQINNRKTENNKFEIVKTSPIIGAFIAVLIFVLSIVLITGNYIHG